MHYMVNENKWRTEAFISLRTNNEKFLLVPVVVSHIHDDFSRLLEKRTSQSKDMKSFEGYGQKMVIQ